MTTRAGGLLIRLLLEIVPGGVLGRLGSRGSCKRITLRRPRVVVVGRVGDDQHIGIRSAALYLLPRRASLGAATPVIPPDVHGTRSARGT